MGVPILYLALTAGAAYGLYRLDSSRRAQAGPEGAFDPEPHKAAISALEQAIYKEEGPAYKVAGPLWEFAAGPGASAQTLGQVPGERVRWIRDWEEIRARHFKPAPWFHAPVAVDPAQPPLAVPEAAERLEKAAFGLAALLVAAEAEPDYAARYLPSRYARDAWLGNMKNWLGEARRLNAESRHAPK